MDPKAQTTATLTTGLELEAWVIHVGPALGPAPRLDSGELCTLDEADRALVRDGQRVGLTPLEFGVIRHLVHNPRRVVTRREFVSEVWDQQVSGSNIVDAVIRRLRRKLGPWAASIETVVGHGYRFERWQTGDHPR